MTTMSRPGHWPAGLPRSLDYPDAAVWQLLAGSARRYGQRTAFHYAGRDIAFTQLWQQACRFANALRAAGIEQGEVVAVHMPNCPQYPVAYYGTLLAGAAFSPVNPLLPPDDLAFQLRDSGAAAAVTYGEAARAIGAVRDRTWLRRVFVTSQEQAVDPAARVDIAPAGAGSDDFEARCADADDVAGAASAASAAPGPAIDVDADLAHLAYTGGITGRPKECG